MFVKECLVRITQASWYSLSGAASFDLDSLLSYRWSDGRGGRVNADEQGTLQGRPVEVAVDLGSTILSPFWDEQWHLIPGILEGRK